MILVNAGHGIKMKLNENEIPILVVEKPSDLSAIISELILQISGEDGNFVISENDKKLNFKKDVELILNPFTMDFNSRKIKNALFKLLEEEAQNYPAEKSLINNEIIELLDKISFVCNYSEIEYDLDFDWKKLFKLYNIRISEENENMTEKIISCIKVLNELCDTEVFIFLNLKDYLETEEILQIYEIIKFLKVKIVLIESHEKEKLSDETLYILDKDRCLIVK